MAGAFSSKPVSCRLGCRRGSRCRSRLWRCARGRGIASTGAAATASAAAAIAASLHCGLELANLLSRKHSSDVNPGLYLSGHNCCFSRLCIRNKLLDLCCIIICGEEGGAQRRTGIHRLLAKRSQGGVALAEQCGQLVCLVLCQCQGRTSASHKLSGRRGDRLSGATAHHKLATAAVITATRPTRTARTAGTARSTSGRSALGQRHRGADHQCEDDENCSFQCGFLLVELYSFPLVWLCGIRPA